MKPKTFEDFLQEQHAEAEPMILDDDLPDAYEAWIGERDIQEIIDFAEKWGVEIRNDAYRKGYEAYKNGALGV